MGENKTHFNREVFVNCHYVLANLKRHIREYAKENNRRGYKADLSIAGREKPDNQRTSAID
jgi:hypothetical protein